MLYVGRFYLAHLITKTTMSCLLASVAICSAPSLVLAQESILTIVQQREQAANQKRPPARRLTTTKVEDITTLPENSPKDYGSKPSTRPQYVKGLKSPKPRANTTVPPKKTPPTNGLNQATAPKQSSDPNKIIAPPGLAPFPVATRKKTVETDPYLPDGIRVGSVNVLPYVGAAGGYNTNPTSANKAKGSPLYQVEGGLIANSDWSTHALNADLRGIYTDYTGVKGANQPEASAKINGRIDVLRDTQIEIETRAKLSSEAVTSINLPGGLTQRPNTYMYGSSLGGTQRYGNVVLNLRGSVDRATFDDATKGNTIINQADRNQNTYALRLRAGYEVSPGITPFVDVTTDTRQFDTAIDRNGVKRSSNGLTGRVGSSFELARTLTGELAIGYGNRSFDDNKLKDLSGLVSEANLVWSISPLTAVRLKAASDLQDTTGAGASGIISRRVGADIEHALLRNVTFGASAEFGRNTTQGAPQVQDSLTAGVRADYKLTKEVVLRSSYTFQKTTANFVGGSFSSHLVLLGLRLQR
jgi:hypothetical protein